MDNTDKINKIDNISKKLQAGQRLIDTKSGTLIDFL